MKLKIVYFDIILFFELFLYECLTCFISGQVLTKKNIEGVIEFAKKENLFMLADEVRNIMNSKPETVHPASHLGLLQLG